MASSSSPYGLQPISSQTGVLRPTRMPLGVANTFGSNIFKYQPVKINPATGTLVPVTAITDNIFGVFEGVEYTPLGGRPAVSPFWPANTNYDTNFDMFAYFWPAWTGDSRWKIQADGPVAQTLMGAGFNFTAANLANGNTSATGWSACTAAAAGVVAGTRAQLALMEFATDITSAVGDAFTDLIVVINNPQIGYQGQLSVG